MTKKNPDIFWRGKIMERCGGKNFDAPSGGYSFSQILAEERALRDKNVPGDPSSALLTLSIADPTGKMPYPAIDAGLEYFGKSSDASRYTDLYGASLCTGTIMAEDTNTQLADYLNWQYKYPSSGVQFTTDYVQYSPGGIKRALAEYIPSLLFGEDGVLIFPTPGYPVIKNAINNRGMRVVDAPMAFESGKWLFKGGQTPDFCR